MSYHIEVPRSGFKELPDRILVREDGYLGAYKFYGEPIVDYWYVPEQDAPQATLGVGTCRNAASSYLDFLCSECGFVHYHSDENDSGDGNDWHHCPNCGRKVVDE